MKNVIDTDIPVPPTNKGQRNSFPFKELKVGESFLVPVENPFSQSKERYALSASCAYWHAKTGFRFTTRKRLTERDGESGFRVWRIE